MSSARPTPSRLKLPVTARRLAAACVLAVVVLFALDGLLFRTGLYTSYLEPDSSAGLFELILWREQQAQAQSGDNLVLTLGDSRFAYYPRVCNQLTFKTGYTFGSAGLAGSDPRSWYYMLRDLDPTRQRYRAIVFGVPDYDDEDEVYNPFADPRFFHYVIARLRWTDAPDIARALHPPLLRWQAFRGALLKGFVLQADVLAFLTHPVKRIEYVQLCHRDFPSWTNGFVESKATMVGLEIDWSTGKAVFPPDCDQNQRDTVNASMLRAPAPQTGRLAAFRREWFGRILDCYRGSRTKMVFLRLPRGPIVRPGSLVTKKSASIREFGARPGVMLMPEHAFDTLERPELYKDGIHLNDEGATRFSNMMATEIASMLGPALTR